MAEIFQDWGKAAVPLSGSMIDTTTASGRLMFGIFAALAEFERELIVERTKAGIAAAKARGKHCGRPPTPNGYVQRITGIQVSQITVLRHLGTS